MQPLNLKSGDPLVLTLAADMRLGPTSFTDDHIWELSLGGGEPPCLAIQTTFGLRARSFRIFPRFQINDSIISDPAAFAEPIKITAVFPNFCRLICSPFPGINAEIELWVPTSQSLAGRTRLTNVSPAPVNMQLEWVALLTPGSDGQRMAPQDIGLTRILAGRTGSLAPTLYLTGVVQPGAGPYPSLMSQVELDSRASRTFTWVEAALSDAQASLEHASTISTCNWDGEAARIALVNAGQLEIHTGDPGWNNAFSLAQKTARGLVLSNATGCSHPSTVSTRLPDQGYSVRGDGSDYTHLWDGQTLYDVYMLIDLLLPGEKNLVRGFLENFLEAQSPDGEIPWKTCLTSKPAKLTAPPLLAILFWRYYRATRDQGFIESSFPRILSAVQSWFSPGHDRDNDGLPEWDHPIQTGGDDHPIFAQWQPWAQGLDISVVEGPDLCAYLYQEVVSMIHLARLVNRMEAVPSLTAISEHLRNAVEAAWNSATYTYQYWDRETHASSPLEILGERQGPGLLTLNRQFTQPVRLLIRLESKDEITRPAQGFIHGTGPSGGHRVERLTPERFRWQLGIGRYTSERIYSSLEHVEIQGIQESDRVIVQTACLTCRDRSVLLPLWAGIPSKEHARLLIKHTLTNPRLFWGAYGIRSCAEKPETPQAASHYQSVYPLWNSLVGEGLLRYDQRTRAADLVTRMMKAIVQNLRQNQAFFHSYHAVTGKGQGERNPLQGLAPLGLFLQVAGIQVISPWQVMITGPNPFPWTVTVKYRGLTVIQHKKKAMIIFPDGQSVTVGNDQPQSVSLDKHHASR